MTHDTMFLMRRLLSSQRTTRTICLLACLTLTFGWAYSQNRQEDMESYYKKWLEEDVVYIITPDERAVFEKLATDDERDQFIEQFWLRRDPDPYTSVNEYKQEHYRRIAYANDHYFAGIQGWRTDRGQIYIRFGPPNGLEKYPEGGTYVRKAEEGGGTTWVHPFEVWFYRNIDGVGTGVEIEFVDVSRTNEYRIALDSDEKDALFLVPGAGLTLAEEFGLESRLDRRRNRYLGNPDDNLRARRLKDYPLQRLEQFYRLSKAPALKYKKLEETVESRISYGQIDVALRSDLVRISDSLSLVPITLFIENKELTFKPLKDSPQLLAAQVDMYGQVQTLGGDLAYNFEEGLTRRLSAEGAAASAGLSIFQKRLPLRPGRYKLSLIVRDTNSGKLATKDHLIVVPSSQPRELQSSSIVLSRGVADLPPQSTPSDPFVLGRYKVVPAETERFSPEEQFVQAYFEVYNLEIDQSTAQPSVHVEISLRKGGQKVFPFQRIEQEYEYDGDRLLVYKTIPFAGLPTGKYTLDFRITDQLSNRSLDRGVDFAIR